MALRTSSLFLYGLEVTQLNSSIDFRAVALETPRQASLTNGFYTLSSLMDEVKAALEAADPSRVYTVTANRNISGGTQNRITISTSGAFFEILFGTGPRVASSSAALLGFNASDYTGSTTYTGSASSGYPLVPNYVGYSYLSPDFDRKFFGSVNVSASGDKEAVLFPQQQFWEVQFKYIPQTTWETDWVDLMVWMVQQRPIEFTPEITSPDTFFQGTLESTNADPKGLAYRTMEMLPSYPFQYDTGLLKFRKRFIPPTLI